MQEFKVVTTINNCEDCPYAHYLDDYIIGEYEPYCLVEYKKLKNVKCPNLYNGKRITLLKRENL